MDKHFQTEEVFWIVICKLLNLNFKHVSGWSPGKNIGLKLALRVNLTEVDDKTLSFGKNKFSIKTCMALGSQAKKQEVESKFATSAYMKIRRDLKENWPYIVTALVLFLLIVAIIVIVMKRMKLTKELAANREKLQKTKNEQRKSQMKLRQSNARLRDIDPDKLQQVMRQMSAEKQQTEG